jgi:hypothetical protein
MFVKRAVPWTLVAALIALSPIVAHAGVYPGNKCLSAKQGAAAKKCQAVFKAWSKWEQDQDNGARDAAIGTAQTKFSDAWSKAEASALSKGVDCADSTDTSANVETAIDTAIADFITALNGGLTLGNHDDAKCGGAIANAAAKKCQAFLKAQSKFIKKPSTDGAAKRDAATGKASGKFSDAYTNAACPTTATEGDLETRIDAISDDVVTSTTISPNVDDSQFTTITLPVGTVIPYEGRDLRPICSKTTPYSYFVKRGSVNKLMVYYQGGGACWDFLTCGLIGTFDDHVDPTGSDNPNNTQVGLGDQGNASNPFADWNVVFVSYCTGDIHFGDSEQTYSGGGLGTQHIEHRGFVNARVVEKFAREHFANPDEVFVTGSSAGAYGAFFNAPLIRAVYPTAKFSVLADAGNGVVTQQFLDEKFPVWNFAANLPTNIPGLADTLTNGTGIPGYTVVVANFFPDVNWAHYSTAYDGGTGGQTGFYNLMLNPTTNPAVAAAEWPKWWEASCEWNGIMETQAAATASSVPSNYRYYIGTGSRHTMFGSNKVYSDVSGGVPTIVDWINAMRNSTPTSPDPVWINAVTSTPGILEPGDPRQNGNPPPDPFVDDNADMTPDRIVCP